MSWAALAAAVLGTLLLPVTAAGKPTDEPQRRDIEIPMSLPASREWAPGELPPREHLRLAYGLSPADAALLDRIALCESGWKPAIENASSTASGLAQFLDSTWRTTRRRMGEPDDQLLLKHDPYEHLDTFVWLWRADGSRHWLESAPCWRR